MAPAVLQWFRRPEYTGENRCVPCTLANRAIAVALAAGLAVVVTPPVGGAVLVAALGSIWLRGYLVPGTPTLTRRFFPERVLALFDKEPVPDRLVDEVAPIDPEAVLRDQGLLEPCPDVDDLCLTPAVATAFETAIERRREEVDRTAELAAFLEVEADRLRVRTGPRGVVRVHIEDEALRGSWESEAALVADLAAASVLEDHDGEWHERSVQERATLAGGLRAFVERCPGCGGPIELGERTVQSCCRSRSVFAVSCTDCDARILEVPAAG